MSAGSHVTHSVALIALAIPVRRPRKESFPSPNSPWRACAWRDVRCACGGRETQGFPQRSLLASCFSINLHSFAAWEIFKLEIRDIAIEISSIRSYVKKCEEKVLRKSLYNLHELESETPGTYISEITLVKNHLQKYDAERYRGARIRSRTTRALHSEVALRTRALHQRARRYLMSVGMQIKILSQICILMACS